MKQIQYIYIYGTVISLAAYLALGLANPISRVFLAIILGAIFISVIKVKDLIKYRPVKALTVFLIFVTIYFLFTWMLVGNNPFYGNIVGFYSNIGLALGIFYLGLYCSRNLEEENVLFKIIFFLCLFATLYRFQMERAIMMDKTYGNRTMNMGYDFVSLLPFLMLFKRKWVPIIVFPVLMYAVIMCIKRGAIIIMVLFLLYFLYAYYIRDVKKYRFRNSVIVVFLILGAWSIMKDFYFQNDYLQVRMQNMVDGDINGRDYIFEKILNHWLNEAGLFEFLFGSGFCASYGIAGNYAHNDWLELLAMSGVIGPLVYFVFFVTEFRFASNVKNDSYKKCIYAILCIWLAKTFFSMSYCAISNMPLSLLLGYLVGESIKENFKLHIYE